LAQNANRQSLDRMREGDLARPHPPSRCALRRTVPPWPGYGGTSLNPLPPPERFIRNWERDSPGRSGRRPAGQPHPRHQLVGSSTPQRFSARGREPRARRWRSPEATESFRPRERRYSWPRLSRLRCFSVFRVIRVPRAKSPFRGHLLATALKKV
jgi:hypothetical protein